MQALNLKSGHVCGQCPTQVTTNHQFCNSLPLPHRLPRPQPLCSCLQRRLRRCYVTVMPAAPPSAHVTCALPQAEFPATLLLLLLLVPPQGPQH